MATVAHDSGAGDGVGQGSAARYAAVARWFHWTVALLIVVNLLIGFFHDGFSRSWIGPVMNAHKAIGLTVLVLSLARLAWRVGHPVPRQMSSHAAWEKTLAKVTHWTLYAFMVLMPLAGWLMVSAAETVRPISFFGLLPLPLLPTGANEALAGLGHEAHELIGWGFVVLLVLHIGGALKHQWIDRDHTLGRMVGWMAPPRV